MPLLRDAEGNQRFGPTWESLSERLIREAMERGEFDNLPYKGQRIPLEDETFALLVAPVLAEFSGSLARGEWQACLAALAALHEKYPELPIDLFKAGA